MGRIGAILVLGVIAAHAGAMPEFLVIGFILASVAFGIVAFRRSSEARKQEGVGVKR
ncbi:MAG: hypothetical protein ACLPJH_08880 [Myxococcaceae bacterium]